MATQEELAWKQPTQRAVDTKTAADALATIVAPAGELAHFVTSLEIAFDTNPVNKVVATLTTNGGATELDRIPIGPGSPMIIFKEWKRPLPGLAASDIRAAVPNLGAAVTVAVTVRSFIARR